MFALSRYENHIQSLFNTKSTQYVHAYLPFISIDLAGQIMFVVGNDLSEIMLDVCAISERN